VQGCHVVSSVLRNFNNNSWNLNRSEVNRNSNNIERGFLFGRRKKKCLKNHARDGQEDRKKNILKEFLLSSTKVYEKD
jgi:hypothetical protein